MLAIITAPSQLHASTGLTLSRRVRKGFSPVVRVTQLIAPRATTPSAMAKTCTHRKWVPVRTPR